MSTILEVRDLTHVYGAGTPFERTALDKVSLSIERGEILGVIGHTGSGKSTLIQHLNGLLRPTSGEVLLAGSPIWNEKGKCERDVRFRVGLVFQYPEYQLFEETVAKDIAFGPQNMGLKEGEIAERVREAMRFVGLGGELAEKSPFALSGGQKRRVAIAGVIAMRPEVLVLDEPTAGLDPRGRRDLIELLQGLHASGMTMVMASHAMDDLARLCDHLLVLEGGRIALRGTPAQVFSDQEALHRLGLAAPAPAAFAARLRERGFQLPAPLYFAEGLAGAVAAELRG